MPTHLSPTRRGVRVGASAAVAAAIATTCLVAVATTAVVIVAPAQGATNKAGKRDPSFGKHGMRVISRIDGGAGAVGIGRKSRIVIVGRRNVARLRPDGRLDRGFGSHGIVTLAAEGAGERFGLGPTSLALGARGGAFVAGRECSGSGTCEFLVARLRPDGELNRSFGNDGTARIGFGPSDAQAMTIAITRGGKLIVAGANCESRDHCHLGLARLDQNGTVEQSFGDRGRVADSLMCTVGGNVRDLHYAMGLDSRGRIVVGGPCKSQVVSLSRYKPNGQLDRSFGKGGLVSKHVRVAKHAQMRGVKALAIDSHDRIDVAGDSATSLFTVARFEPNGTLDRSFGTNGSARFRVRPIDEPAFPYVTSMAIDSRARIVVAGSAYQGFAFVRFKPGGKVDRHFGDRGQVLTRGAKALRTDSVAIDRRNRIVGAGGKPPRLHGHPALIRLLG